MYDDIWLIVLEFAHDCATNTPDPRPLRLVSKRFQQLVLATPILWHHVVRRVSHFNSAALRSRIGFSTGAPLILSIELAHGDDLAQFAPIFRDHQHQWHSIEIQGCDLSLLCPVFNGCALSSLESLSLLPCGDPEDDDPSLGVGLWVIRAPRLRYLRLHVAQLRLFSSDVLERLYVKCQLPSHQTPVSLKAVFAHPNLTRLLLSDLRADNPLPSNQITLPCLTTFILFNVYAEIVRPILDILIAPQLHTLAVTIAISSPFASPHVTPHLTALHGYPRLRLVQFNQAGIDHHPRVLARMLYSLGWAFPSAIVLQTNINWGVIVTALNPTPADIPFIGQTTISLPPPFPRIQTLALRDGRPRSLAALAQCLEFRAQTPHAIIKCGVESHLLDTVRARIPSEVETVEWNRDFDAEMQPLYTL